MTLIEDLQKWQEDLEELSIERSKAEGRLELAMEALKAIGFDTVKDAQKALDKLLEEQKVAEEDAELLITKFKEKYEGFIEHSSK